MVRPTRRKYWSERQGRGPKAEPLDFENLKRLVLSVTQEFWDDDYLVEAFGYVCVDSGEVNGLLGGSPERWFLVNLQRDNVWPMQTHGADYDADTLFDMVEALYDLVSKPISGWYHDYASCGQHWQEFDKALGQETFRVALNPLLELYETPLELLASGEIVTRGPAELNALLEAAIPEPTDADLKQRVQTAVGLFRSRNSTQVDRRHAVRELADVLEPLRGSIKEEMLPEDERAIFHIANGFTIRHNNRHQRKDYDDAIWLSWAFYVYLATIHAVLRLQARLERQQSPGSA